MSQRDNSNIYVGSNSGTFEGVTIGTTECLTNPIQKSEESVDSNAITSLSWGDDDENEVLFAYGEKSDRRVKVYNRSSSAITCSILCNYGEGRITGLSRYNEGILTAVHSGDVKLWTLQNEDSILFNAGENLEKMCHSKIHRNIIATGGENNALKLFDLERKVPIFVGKNLPHNTLQMRNPVWISDINFIPTTQEIVTVGRYGHVSLYDPRAQRRPVVRIEVQTQSLTALGLGPNNKQVLVGSGRGRLHLIDMKKPAKILNTYTGFLGAITGLACSKRAPQVISISLDRHVRVHHMHTRRLLQEAYLTSRLTCLLVRSEFKYPELKKPHENVDSDSEYDIVFEKLRKVEDKENEDATGKKRKPSTSNTFETKADDESRPSTSKKGKH